MQPVGSTFGGTATEAAAVNNLGFVVGVSYLPNNSTYHAFIWKGGQLQDLQAGDDSVANGINDNNEVAGTSNEAEYTPAYAFLWAKGKIDHIPGLGGLSDASGAQAINSKGHVAGSSQIAGVWHAFLYANGQIHDLGTVDVVAINANDQMVGDFVVDVNNGATDAFLYSGGRRVDLNSFLPKKSGWILTGATGINDVGQIVGNGTHNGLSRAFLMTPNR